MSLNEEKCIKSFRDNGKHTELSGFRKILLENKVFSDIMDLTFMVAKLDLEKRSNSYITENYKK